MNRIFTVQYNITRQKGQLIPTCPHYDLKIKRSQIIQKKMMYPSENTVHYSFSIT